jgi:polyphosphate kinase 2 (PPK2 family)
MGFCTKEQYKRFMKKVSSYEKNFIDDGKTVLLKLYFSVSKHEQSNRFESRKLDPLKQYKLSPVDNLAQKLWDKYSIKKFQMLNETNRSLTPWTIIRSDNKKRARINCMKHILSSVEYQGKLKSDKLTPDPEIVISGIEEIKHMEQHLFKPKELRG